MSYKSKTFFDRIAGTVRAYCIINRFEALLAYNIGYMLIILAMAYGNTSLRDKFGWAVLFFSAVLFMKAQASVADALHDYQADKRNPYKSYVPDAVDWFGYRASTGILVGQMAISLVCWLYLTLLTGETIFLAAGLVSNFFGFTYSYPPRFKERGVFNHVVTSSVDIFCVLIPGVLLLTGSVSATDGFALAVVYLYSFAYHVMHQAGDTYPDRRFGVSTFTQKIGIENSVFMSYAMATLATIVGLCGRLYPIATGTLLFTGYLLSIYRRSLGASEREQSNIVSRRFAISACATTLNLLTAISLFVVEFAV